MTTIIGLLLLAFGLVCRLLQDIDSCLPEKTNRGRTLFRQCFFGNQLCLYGLGALIGSATIGHLFNKKLPDDVARYYFYSLMILIILNMLVLLVLFALWYWNRSRAYFLVEPKSEDRVNEQGLKESVTVNRIRFLQGIWSQAGLSILVIGNSLGMLSALLPTVYLYYLLRVLLEYKVIALLPPFAEILQR